MNPKIKNNAISLAIFTLFLLTTISYANLGISLELNNKSWVDLINNSTFTITSDINYAIPNSKKFPRFKVSLKYKCNRQNKINWSKNFGRLLWEGKIILISSSRKNGLKTTAELKYRTSNTYNPDKPVILKRGKRLTSTLDFKKLPGSYALNLFNHKGKTTFRLYTLFNKKLKPISNEITIMIK